MSANSIPFMLRNTKILLFLLVIFSIISEKTYSMDNLSGLPPDSPKGWIKSESAQIYNRENLFDYIDGGAEVYLAYDFQKLAVQQYIPVTKDSLGENSITVEIWQMNSSADAYGVFSLDQEGDKENIGQTGVYFDGLLRFWKDVFFVKILEVMGDSKDVVLKLGSQIDKKIKKEGKLPQLVLSIPSDSLIPSSIHYFHKLINLNDLYYFSDQNILNLSMETDCALADFKLGDEKLKLLLIQCQDTVIARSVEENLKMLYLTKEYSSEDKIFQTKEKKLLGLDSMGNYLLLVFEGIDRENILWLLNRAKSPLEGSGQQQKPRCFRIH